MLLQSVADGIKAVLREKCIAMRVGGDEIFMVCPHTSKEKAEVLVQKMKGADGESAVMRYCR